MYEILLRRSLFHTAFQLEEKAYTAANAHLAQMIEIREISQQIIWKYVLSETNSLMKRVFGTLDT